MQSEIRDAIPIVAICAGAAMAIFIPLVRAYAKRLERGTPSGSGDAEVAARLARMEQSIESIAVEIERVSEGQRFTTKLLSTKVESERINRDEPQR
jgi:hypothetical protein